jgi:uncharacterized protein (AIM24 family)
MNQYTCPYCRQPSDPAQPACPLCGAPVDLRAVVSESGWVEQPAIRDLTRIQFGQSHVQIAGARVPTAEFTLAPQDWIYFSHHTLLWSEPQTRLESMRLKGAWNRVLAGLPLVMLTAAGPGHISLSDNHAGDVVALPLQHGQSMWVREHRFLCATGNVGYDWQANELWYTTRVRKGEEEETEWHYPMGQNGDIFTAHRGPGLLLLHSPGSTFVRDLMPGQSLLVQPSSLLYRDLSVRARLHVEYPRNHGIAFWRSSLSYRNVLARLSGPGRVAVQSVYQPGEECGPIWSVSNGTTERQW